jgi:tRNA A-37 threonylcarbamoyl transferase component Bud32
MNYKKYIYLLFLKRWLSIIRAFFDNFKRGKRRKRKLISFNIFGTEKKSPTLEMIDDMAFKVFKEKPLDIQFFSQSQFGHYSFKIFFSKKSYRILKCREFFSEKYTAKVEELINILNSNGVNIPKVLGKYKNYLFTEWIEGKQLRLYDFLKQEDLIEKIAKYQALIHFCPFPERLLENKKKSDYLEFLKERFIFFGSKYVEMRKLLKIVKRMNKLTPLLKPSITCPDLTDGNLLFENGNIFLIDKENINVDFGYEYDIINTQKSFFQGNEKLENYYLSLYKKYHSPGTLESHADFWKLLFDLRLAGSWFQAQDSKAGKFFVEKITKKLKESKLL